MSKIKKSIEIDAPVEEVFAFFSDPENLPEVWPSMVEVSNVSQGNGNRGFDWTYKMAGIKFHGRSEIVEFVENERVVSKNDKGIPSTFVYTYEDMAGRTRLTVECDYDIPGKVLGRLAEPIVHRINEHEAETLLHNLKARMELAEQAGVRTSDEPRPVA